MAEGKLHLQTISLQPELRAIKVIATYVSVQLRMGRLPGKILMVPDGGSLDQKDN